MTSPPPLIPTAQLPSSDQPFKPMLACRVSDSPEGSYELSFNDLTLPKWVSVKLDGIRAVTQDGIIKSRSLKPIRNRFVQRELAGLPNGLDGELMLRDTHASFQDVVSAIMSESGEPDFQYWIFDHFQPGVTFCERTAQLLRWIPTCPSLRASILPHVSIDTPQGLIQHVKNTFESEAHCPEGLMLRNPGGQYKQGRATARSQDMVKYKPVTDSTARVIGFVEKLTNTNPPVTNELGHTERSREQSGLVPAGSLGALIVEDIHKPCWQFEIGTFRGLNLVERQEIWTNQTIYLNRFVDYSYLPHGTLNRPRHPVFLRWRDPDTL